MITATPAPKFRVYWRSYIHGLVPAEIVSFDGAQFTLRILVNRHPVAKHSTQTCAADRCVPVEAVPVRNGRPLRSVLPFEWLPP